MLTKIKNLFSDRKLKQKKELDLATLEAEINTKSTRLEELRKTIEFTTTEIKDLEKAIVNKEDTLKEYREEAKSEVYKDLEDTTHELEIKKIELAALNNDKETIQKEINRYGNQARKFKSEIVGLKKFKKTYPANTDLFTQTDTGYYVRPEVLEEANEFLSEESLLDTIIKLHTHTDNSKELKKLSNATRKEIDTLLNTFKTNYTTKANETIYELMVIGLQAEIQNLLFTLNFNNLEDSKISLSKIFDKYLALASQGNKSILPTITRFLTQLQPLYSELLTIEYKHYLYKQQEKEEQRQLREQAKQDKEEQRALEEERQKLEQEENKFQQEINRNLETLSIETDPGKLQILEDRIKELEEQMQSVQERKEVITSLSHGKAGYVYIVSNKGAFGENVFKVGMTRRSNPEDRINELGGASVPFRFDIHALVFSEDAVAFEAALHNKLSSTRINKVNYRKEFFESSIEEMAQLVEEIDPTASFDSRMIAEDYNQSQYLSQVIDEGVTEVV